MNLKSIANFDTAIAARGILTALAALSALTALSPLPAAAQTNAEPAAKSASAVDAPSELAAPRLSGSGKLTVLGFDIYAAKLWVGKGFLPAQYTQHPFALELTYLRNFKGRAIAERTVKEMRKLAEVSDAQAQAWLDEWSRAVPDVKAGDRLTGVFRPGRGLLLRQGNTVLADWNDPTMAALFMGIWLSPQTSDPSLRTALLAGVTP
jgi:Chalcone isomerase-like